MVRKVRIKIQGLIFGGGVLNSVCCIFFFVFSVGLSCQSVFAQPPKKINKIVLEHADVTGVDKGIASDATRMRGNVRFKHDDVIMTCDSAYYYGEHNMLDAFSRVHITKTDGSVTIDGDMAKYQGNIKFAEIWNNVVLVDSNATMKTQHLYYDMNTNIAYYLVGAQILNKGNDMVSKLGYYHRDINMFYFKKDVVLNTPDYIIVTDTLNYNVQTKVADFVGPTFIQNEKDTIYCELGWYNTNDTVALFRRNAWIKSGSTTVNADTLYYESKTGNGRAFGNIVIVDTTNNIILKGHKGEFHKPTEKAWITKKALLIMVGKQDSLFLHADTLRSDIDTSGYKIMKAYNKVKFYSMDMQGKCDSLTMTLKDSIIHMYRLPVLWAQANQMTAEYIEIETENQHPKRMNLLDKGFIVSEEDTVGFNQIKGKKIIGLFRDDNELYRVNVYGDGEAIYYMRDGLDITGVNKSKSPDIVIFIKNRKAEKVTHVGATEGELIPPNEFSTDELTLMGFKWRVKYRPVDKYDIFHWIEETDEKPTSGHGDTRNQQPKTGTTPAKTPSKTDTGTKTSTGTKSGNIPSEDMTNKKSLESDTKSISK